MEEVKIRAPQKVTCTVLMQVSAPLTMQETVLEHSLRDIVLQQSQSVSTATGPRGTADRDGHAGGGATGYLLVS